TRRYPLKYRKVLRVQLASPGRAVYHRDRTAKGSKQAGSGPFAVSKRDEAATEPSMPASHQIKASEEDFFSAALGDSDPEIAEAIKLELHRQRDEIELIASENIVSRAVLEAQGSVLTNKYAEGLPGKRYYGGCQFVDVAERLAIERATRLFGCS